MESRSKPQHTSKVVASINNPLFFTAPHSGQVYRGGVLRGDKRRLHLREKYTSALAIKFALDSAFHFQKAGSKSKEVGSVCFWAKEHKLNDYDVDPNYLHQVNSLQSPFHQALHQFIASSGGKPLLHVDIHGKMDRKSDYDLDLGITCIIKHWPIQEEFYLKIEEALVSGFNSAIQSQEKGGIQAVTNSEPYLNGNWGYVDIATMTEQAVVLGIPSLQLEIPLSLRKKLFADDKLSFAFSKVIVDTYLNVVVPWWPFKTAENMASVEIASLLNSEPMNFEQMTKIWKEYQAWESKVKAKPEKTL